METRDGHGIEVRPGPDLVVTRREADAETRPAGAPGSRRPLLVAVWVAGLLVAALLVVVVAVLAAGGDEDVVARPPAPAGAEPARPAPLGLTVRVPEEVVAGQAARVTVRWTDGAGVLNGSTEEWGDGVGTSSLGPARCAPGAAGAEASAGTYDVTHTWSEPGSYRVVMGVATYTCDAGTAVEEQASTTLTVEVVPAG